MARSQLRGSQVKDGSIQKADLDTVTPGQAVVTKIVDAANTGVELNTSSGVDAGTGDVSLKINRAYLDTQYPSMTGTGANIRAQNTFLAAPSTGGSGLPTFRTITPADIPTLAYAPTTHTHDDRYYTENESDGRFVKLGDIIQNNNVFGGRKLYITGLDNALAAADKKFFVVATRHKKVVNSVTYPKPINAGDVTLPQWEDSPVVATVSAAPLFNNNYEDNISVPSDEYLKVSITFSADGTAIFSGYPYGTYYISYYYTQTPKSAVVRTHNLFAGHGVGYKTGAFSDFIGTSNSAAYVQSHSDQGNYSRRLIEFIIEGDDTHSTGVSQIEWALVRPATKDSPTFSNHGINKSYTDMYFGTQTVNNIALLPSGQINAVNIIASGTVSAVGGNSTNWNAAYNDKINSATFTATTFTLTQQDGGTVAVSVPTFNQNTTGASARVTVLDNRGADRLPNYYPAKALIPFFTDSLPSVGGWGSGIHVNGWDAGTYAGWQIYGGSNTTAINEWYLRSGTTAWGTSHKIWHSSNLPQSSIDTWNDAVTKLGAQNITGLKNFQNGFDINTHKFRAIDATNVIVSGGKNAFNNNLTNISDSAVGIGNNVFPAMNLQPYDPVTEPWNNKGYVGIGSDIFNQYTGATNYRPTHNAHDSWIGVGRLLGSGFLDGTNVTMLGTTNLHRNDVPYADCVTIIGKGFSNGIKTRADKPTLDPNRVVLSKNGTNVHGMMTDVIGIGHENWLEDINQSVVIGSNLRAYSYVYNSLVLGHHHSNWNPSGNQAQADMYIDSDVIIGMGVSKRFSRHADSHNLLIGHSDVYQTGAVPNDNYRPLVEGLFKNAKFQVNGVLVAGHETLDSDKPNELDVPLTVGALPSGVTFDVLTNVFTFNGTQTSTEFTVSNINIDPNSSIYIEINAPTHVAGSWGSTINGIVDSGNTAAINWTTRQSFIPFTGSEFKLSTAGNFQGTLKVIFKKTDLLGAGALSNIQLKDSFENITSEFRGGTIGNKHLSIGLNAGKFLHLGTDSLIVGNNAYSKSTFASNSTIIGNNAAASNSASFNDVIIGNKSFENSTLGSGGNVLVGGNTLRSPLQRITETTGIGYEALTGVKYGTANTGVGKSAGATLEDGSDNLFVGWKSGFIKNGSGNTFLGTLAGGYGLTTATVNNTIVIGYNAVPEVANNTTTIATAANTDNFLYGITHSNSFKVRGGTATQVMMANGTLKEESTFGSGHAAVTLGTQNGLSLAGQVLSLGAASTSTTGALTSIDWNTFNGKQPLIASGTTAQYYRGDKTWQTLSTSAVTEGTNLYFTGGRVLATTLAGYTVGANTALAIADTIVGAFGKVQGQINNKVNNSQVLTNVPAGAVFTDTVYVHPTTTGNKHIPAGGTTSQILRWSADGTAVWSNEVNTTYTNGAGLGLAGSTFSVLYGTTANTAAQGNDSRITNGQTSYDWGNHRAFNGNHSLGADYNGGANQPNDAYFGPGKLKLAMVYGPTLGMPYSAATEPWYDVLWMSSYIGTDVAGSTAIVSSKQSNKIGFIKRNFNDTSWGSGTYREFMTQDDRVNNSFRKLLIFAPTGGSLGTVTVEIPFSSLVSASTLKIKVSSLFQNSNNAGYIEVDYSFMNTDTNGFYNHESSVVSVKGPIADYITVDPQLQFVNGKLQIKIHKQSTIDNTLYIDVNLMVPYVPLDAASQQTFARDALNAATVTMATGTPPAGKNLVSFVTIDTTQTISGTKTFSNAVTAPAFYESSLRALKENIHNFEDSGLELVNKLDVVTFDRIDGTAKNKIGIIADDSPEEFLSKELDAVDLYKTVFIQAKAIQELTARLEKLEKIIEDGR